MENRSYALAAGIFALVLGAALVVAIWWFGEERDPTRDYILVSRGNIGSLNLQAGVRYRGMAAGKVTDIRLDPEDPHQILVTIRIREELPLTMGTRAILDSQGVTGIAFIQLDDFGTDPRPLPAFEGGPPRLDLEPSMITKITEATLEAMQGLDNIAGHLSGFLSGENQNRFADILGRLESIAEGVDQALAEMPATLAGLRELAGPENQARIKGLLQNFEQAGAEAVPAVQEFRELLTSLEATSHQIQGVVAEVGGDLQQAGNHLAADTLPRVNHLLSELNVGSRRLNRLLAELEAEPRLLLRGRGELEPGPGEH